MYWHASTTDYIVVPVGQHAAMLRQCPSFSIHMPPPPLNNPKASQSQTRKHVDTKKKIN